MTTNKTTKSCFLCDKEESTKNEFHILTSPDKTKRLFCTECMADFYHFVNSGQAERLREERVYTGLGKLPTRPSYDARILDMIKKTSGAVALSKKSF